jgi:hypothetical protein
MNRANEVTEELEGMGSILAVLSRAMPYSVPAGYFEEYLEFADNDLLKFLKQDAIDPKFNHPGLTGAKSMPYTLPDGYFEELANNVVAAAKADNNELLGNLSKSMPNSLPAGYFDALPARMLQAAKIASPVKRRATTIPLGGNTFRQLRWAAAAILVVCIGLGSYVSFFSGSGQSGTESMLASVPKEEIQDYLQHSYILDVNRIINNDEINKIQVDNSDIVQYLNETGWDVVD